MDISAVCVSKAVSSTLYSSFSDQSHLQFYGHASTFLAPSKLRFKIPCRSLTSVTSMPVTAPLQALCDTACKSPMELTAEQALMKELADLKLQMKQRKKELKAHMKDDKKKLKLQVKEEKKRRKQKDAQEGKTKVKCKSESSSSESSDEECSSVSMQILRQGQFMLEDARLNSRGGPVLENCIASSAGNSSSVCTSSKDDPTEICTGVCPNFLFNTDAMEGCMEKSLRASASGTDTCLTVSSMGSFNGCTSIPEVISELVVDVQNHASICGMLTPCKSLVAGQLGPTSLVLPTLEETNRIEVCVGGKCKKAGSEKLLLALQGQIPGSSNVEAVPCKCMGKCSMAINVRVVKEDTNPLHHSHVGAVEDASLILGHHFGLGCPPAGLPSLSAKDGIRVPATV